MSYENSSIRFTKKGVDAKTAAATLVFTPDKDFVPTSIVFTVSAADTVAVVPSISFGTNATDYNNVLASSALTGMDSTSKMLRFSLGLTAYSMVAAGTGCYVKVNIGATATTCTIQVNVLGFYL